MIKGFWRSLLVKHAYLVLIIASTCLAEPFGPNQIPQFLSHLRDQPVMNGIDPKHFDQFWTEWELVTVRHRNDTNEQRFIYANATAYSAMRAGLKEYPEGARFAKIGFALRKDAAFPNSSEPFSVARMQFMEKSSAYKDSDGWGYAIYGTGVGDGKKEDPESVMVACHACHKLVPERDFVFARPIFTESALELEVKALRETFVRKSYAELSIAEKEILALTGKPEFPKLYYHSMPMFSGSINESLPALAGLVATGGGVALLVDSKAELFAIAYPDPTASGSCRSFVLTIARYPTAGNRESGIRKGQVCDGVFQQLR